MVMTEEETVMTFLMLVIRPGKNEENLENNKVLVYPGFETRTF
jgi:hypothetical protein